MPDPLQIVLDYHASSKHRFDRYAPGTGIGCFFDDGVHALLELTDRRFQSLYHFTVGVPVDDTRLTTRPAYPD